jgi:preprotein translocase subunit SecE
MSSMAKPKEKKAAGTANPGLMATMLQVGFYKPLQGRIVRQVTFVVVGIISLMIAWNIASLPTVRDAFSGSMFVFGLIFTLMGLWFAFRLVNYPVFADFLIAVEAEMNKVSWPTWPELWKASMVVIFVIFAMALALWVFDLVWSFVFTLVGIR